ncbi:hypothetical protein OH491_17445 [Termitidicoccus mucosus]|uniref:Uncharacterized protein n=1 Tax=Termitidicoccus mucosus TaxID=1184151 RepID=A0A178IL04_9BACT|nr:hypothetical protein AW736_11150 [Opitutaceae bacterium TSB47]
MAISKEQINRVGICSYPEDSADSLRPQVEQNTASINQHAAAIGQLGNRMNGAESAIAALQAGGGSGGLTLRYVDGGTGAMFDAQSGQWVVIDATNTGMATTVLAIAPVQSATGPIRITILQNAWTSLSLSFSGENLRGQTFNGGSMWDWSGGPPNLGQGTDITLTPMPAHNTWVVSGVHTQG